MPLDGTGHSNYVDLLRSRVTTLELELTILKAQRLSDRAKVEQLDRDIVVLRHSSRELVDRIQRITQTFQRLQFSHSRPIQPSPTQTLTAIPATPSETPGIPSSNAAYEGEATLSRPVPSDSITITTSTLPRIVACLLSHDDNGLSKPGLMLDLHKWKEHAANDTLRDEEEEHVMYAALMTAVSASNAPHDTLEARPRDHTDFGGEGSESPPSHRTSALPMDVDPPSVPAMKDDDALVTRLQELSLLESALYHQSRHVPARPTLKFRSSPASLHDALSALLPSHEDCQRLTTFRAWLETHRHTLRMLPPLGHRDADRRRGKLLQRISDELDRLTSLEVVAWEREKLLSGLYGFPGEAEVGGPLTYHTEHLYISPRTMQPFVLIALLVTCALHTLSGVNRGATNLLLVTLQALLVGAFISCNNEGESASGDSSQDITFNPARKAIHARSKLSSAQKAVVDSVPRDIQTVLSHLGIEPDVIRFASCPSCSQTYPPNESAVDDPYPRTCTFTETDKPVCGTPLVRKVAHAPTSKNKEARFTYAPLRPYPYRPLFSWIASLFSRVESETMIESAWDRSTPSPGPRWFDILQAPALRNFRAPDGAFYWQQPEGATHLVFGLFIDWFNPGGNKKAGKARSIGAIYLVCYNLPPALRFRPENICLLGIIPGPSEPSLHQLNHFLRPLVDEFLVLWHSGIRLTRTALHAGGRLVRAVIIPLICDLPALRKAAGFAGHSSNHFCSFCLLKRSRMNDLSRPWPSRTWKEHVDIATRWRDAPTEAVRKEIFEEHGVRWSELLRLPYWDPTRYAVVDAMHNLFLGELKHHCTEVWGIDVKDKVSTSKQTPHSPSEQQKWLDRLVVALRKGTLSAVMQPRKGYLVAVAQLNGVVPQAKLTKRDYAKALLQWVRTHSAYDLQVPPVLCKDTTDFHLAKNAHDISKYRVLTPNIIEQLRNDIMTTYLPSWMERPPANFGSAAHGKLKADHWRTVCSVSMVITLVRIWASSTTPGDKLLLDNFIHLVIAADLATRHSMDPERARLFDEHMLAYLQTLRALFEHDLVPNHHLSLHLASCLLLFGPVRGWWAYPFERYNGIIQRLNTNNHIAEIPLTFMRLFYAGAELRCSISATNWPDFVQYRKVLEAFDDVYKDTSHGSRIIDVIDATSNLRFGASADDLQEMFDGLENTKLDHTSYHALVDLVLSIPGSADVFTPYYSGASDHRSRLSPLVSHLPTLMHGGVVYGTRTRNIRNSFICFKNPGELARSSREHKNLKILSLWRGALA
ncbi:hypothetical protein GSI_02019 [Ganoderma sinense ZZ0214-1]|uniref:Uncharacterized protein n=1 Tax=Ganoderma sinense ZZ0214-1 TaxID=1077348 RepID=A0A2G8SNE9_9APHY|nr:hypothetical protein GSI_02019 [Ganoderma sinense ZZ0214-1]